MRPCRIDQTSPAPARDACAWNPERRVERTRVRRSAVNYSQLTSTLEITLSESTNTAASPTLDSFLATLNADVERFGEKIERSYRPAGNLDEKVTELLALAREDTVTFTRDDIGDEWLNKRRDRPDVTGVYLAVQRAIEKSAAEPNVCAEWIDRDKSFRVAHVDSIDGLAIRARAVYRQSESEARMAAAVKLSFADGQPVKDADFNRKAEHDAQARTLRGLYAHLVTQIARVDEKLARKVHASITG